MILLIPSYKRTDILHWVLQSVLMADTRGINERILILLVNNYPPNRDTVDSIVSNVKFENNFICQIIHREKTLPAVQSWFSAISSKAGENETVILLGDDDILLPWGLVNRYRQIMECNADLVISDFCQRLYFFQKGEQCWYDFQIPGPPPVIKDAVIWENNPKFYHIGTFISNHCFRYTVTFRAGLEKAMSWCEAQDWVPPAFSTGNLPGYLPYAIKSVGGKVVSLHEFDVIRGSVVEEALLQDYADGGNTAFYCLLIFNTFNNPSLHDDIDTFDELRKSLLQSFLRSCVGIARNKNISHDILYETMRRSGLNKSVFMSMSILYNYREILRMIPFFRGFRLKRVDKRNFQEKTKDFLEKLFSNS